MRRLACLFILALCFSLSPARADTTVYTDSSDPFWASRGFAPAVNAGDSTGPADGNSAFVPIGGFVAYLVSPTFNWVDIDVEFLGVTGAGTLRLYVGRADGGGGFTQLNSAFFTVSDGVTNLTSTALSNYCRSIGGCDTFVLQAWTGTTFSLDSVIAATPTPGAWALMILGFAAVAFRMKQRRGASSPAPKTIGAAAAFS